MIVREWARSVPRMQDAGEGFTAVASVATDAVARRREYLPRATRDQWPFRRASGVARRNRFLRVKPRVRRT